MGAAESKQVGGINRDRDEEEKRKNNSSSSSSSSMGSGGTALAVGAAAGAALLGVAWSVSQFRSKDETAAGADHQLHGYHAQSQGVESLISNFSRNMRMTNSNLQLESRFAISLKILSYNVCCKEEYGIQERMKAISALVERYSPHFICFQEITPEIYNTFEASSWWADYHCSMSREKARKRQYFCILLSKFPPVDTTKARLGNSEVKRQLWVTETKVENNKSLVVATSHLKSRCPRPNDPNSQYHQYKRERQLQAKQAVNILQKYPNVIFCGDMNWNEKVDGEFPLGDGWVDAWTELKGDEKGYTFDTKLNGMLKGRRNVRMRLDRILCNLKGFRLEDIDIIGEEAIPDASYQRNKKQLPVLPSDHYGLLLTICPTYY